MPRFTYIQNSFSSGEVSEKLAFRNDIKEFGSGASEMTRFMPYKSGGASSTPGFRKDIPFLHGAGGKNKAVILPFFFGVGLSYHLEIVLNAITPLRVYNRISKTYLTCPVTTAAKSSFNGETDPYGFSLTQIDHMLILCHSSGTMPPVLVVKDITSPSTKAADLFSCSAITDDVFTSMRYLDRLAVLRVPMMDPNKTGTTITPAGTDPAITLTASTNTFYSEHVGSYFMLDDQSGTPRHLKVKITGYTSATVVTGVVAAGTVGSFTMAATDYWYEAAWSDVRGWPKTITSYEGRAIFGGTIDSPNTFWGSESYNPLHLDRYFNFIDTNNSTYDRTPDALSSAFEFSIPEAPIQWMAGGSSLIVGSTRHEYIVNGGDTFLSKDSVQVKKQTAHGGSSVPPAEAENSTYFISKDGKSIIEFSYSNENGSFISRNLTTLSEDILHKYATDRRTKIIKIAWQESNSTLWALTNTKKLLAVTINKEAQVTAFHSHPIANTDVYDILVMPNADLTYDEVSIIADHASFGDANNMELLKLPARFEHTDLFNASTNDEDACIYLDFGAKITRAASAYAYVATNGTLLTVLGDDNVVYENVEVTGNSFTLTGTPTDVYAGIPYTPILKTLRLEVGPNQLLNSQGDVIRMDRATIKLYKTFAGQYGSDDTDLYDFEIESDESYTGIVQVDLPQNSDVDNRVVISADKPLPLNVIGIVFRGQNNS